ncbi:MAG TPA: choice-of-anchor R domain-containing protein [Candidatus Binatia bacterium]|nr:choice-of-anchor R domain-containing protein [Candidatus Binatia bacterium]
MFRRALLLALVPALVIFAGCSDDDHHDFKPIVTTTLISNLSGAENAEISLDSGRVAAVGFTMPDTSYALTAARLKLRVGAGESDSIVVRLFRNSGGNPSSPILTFNKPLLLPENNTPTVSTFTTPVLYTLQADSTYWIVVYNAGSGSVGWTTGSPSLTPTGLATFAGARLDSLIAPAPPTSNTNAIGQFSVIGTRINP